MRGRGTFRKLNFYEPIPARMSPSETLEGWLVSSRHLRAGKSPQTIAQSYLQHWDYPVEETAFGLANIARGLTAPLAGSFDNPLTSGSQALGRAVYWGLALHGKPDEAAEFAYYDASIDHAGDGVWAAVAVARMAAIAQPGLTAASLVRAATNALPKESLCVRAIPAVLQGMGVADGPAQVCNTLAGSLQVQDARHAALSLGYALAGLIHGAGDFGKSVLATAGCGGASDQSTLVTGALAGLLAGEVPSEWTSPLGNAFVVGIGLKNLDPPSSIADFADLIGQDNATFGWVAPEPKAEPAPEPAAEAAEPEEASTEPAAPEPQPAPAEPAKPLDLSAALPAPRVRDLLLAEPNESITEVEGIRLSAKYLDPPVAKAGVAMRLVLTFTNIRDTEAVLDTALAAPDGWAVASRLTSFRLRPGESSSFPAVVQPIGPEIPPLAQLRLKMNRYQLLVPVIGSQRWYWVGPFVNHDGAGFDRIFPAEFKQDAGEVFNGRSDLPVRWTESLFSGVTFDLEPYFRTGPGVVYLYALMQIPNPGPGKLVVASSVGAIAWVNGQKALWYHERKPAVPRPAPPYVADVVLTENTKLLVKVLRDRPALEPVTIYILSQDGKLVVPEAFLPMPQ